jgi:GT2 family glycosyltransferase
VRPEIEGKLPSWVRYYHTSVEAGVEYSRSATFNVGARMARGEVLILHDNDMVVPDRYAAENAARVRDGWRFVDAKRFNFYLREEDTGRIFESGQMMSDLAATVVQNLRGGSTAATRDAFFAIGGFDEEFIGWGGEDLDFWERAVAHGGVYVFGYLPLVHLWHPPQKGKGQSDAPAVRRYRQIRTIPPEERIRRLRTLQPPPP